MPPPAASSRQAPLVPASVSLPEITVKAVVLGVLLSVVLARANAYLGLLVVTLLAAWLYRVAIKRE